MFSIDEHVEVEATCGIYRWMIAAYRHPEPAAGRELMVKPYESLSAGVPRPLVEIAKLGRTLSRRAADVQAYFDRPGASNGPTEGSAAAWSTCAAPPAASATSPTNEVRIGRFTLSCAALSGRRSAFPSPADLAVHGALSVCRHLRRDRTGGK
jgi:hypothetical protein